MKNNLISILFAAVLSLLPGAARAAETCADCHRKHSAALVMEWDRSKHAKAGVDCLSCHGAEKDNPGSWVHRGERISMIVTPKDCAQCHDDTKEPSELG